MAKPKRKEIVYAGQHLYWASQSMMPAYYEFAGGKYHGYTLNDLQQDLDQGYTVAIRPSTALENTNFENALASIKMRMEHPQ